ncbi:MAG: hypothetical protein AAFQ94_22570 [Bacteroidota bacterium]
MKIYVLFIVLFSSTLLVNAQNEKQKLKFVGYEKGDPVFAKKTGDSENSQIQLIRYSESTGNSTELIASNEYKDVISYSDGRYVAISQYSEVLVIIEGENPRVEFQKWPDNDDFQERTVRFSDALNVANVRFGSTNEALYYPVFNQLKIKENNLLSGDYAEFDFTEISNFGYIIAPYKSKTGWFFLASINGPYSLYQIKNETGEFNKAPFQMGERNGFGIKYHPDGNQVLCIYNGFPVAYRFDLDKFQHIRIAEEEFDEKSGFQDFFTSIYFSKKYNNWGYASWANGTIQVTSLNVKSSTEAFSLDLEGVKRKAQEEKDKRRDELEVLFDRLKKAPKPFDQEAKAQINASFEAYEAKNSGKAETDPKMFDKILSTRILRLDTAIVPIEALTKNEKKLIAMVKAGKLNYQPFLGMRLMGRLKTNQPPVHPARVRVIEALVLDYLNENTITNYEELAASGIDFLNLAYQANENNGQALKYNSLTLDYLNKFGTPIQLRPTLEARIDLLIKAKKYEDAISAIALYKKDHLDESSPDFVEKDMELEIQRAYALAGMNRFKEAEALLITQQDRLYAYLKESNSTSNSWAEFTLLYTFTEIYFDKKPKEGNKRLETLMEFSKGQTTDFFYGKMYRNLEKLLTKMNQLNLLSKLPEPRR